VFLWYFQPSGEVVDQVRFKGAVGRYGGPTPQPGTWRVSADEVVVAIDAQTGKTVWKRVFADEGINIQSGKDPGISNHTMCYWQGKVYALGTMNRVYCLDAKSGKLLWRGENDTTAQLEKRKQEGLKAGRMVDKGGHAHEHGRGISGLVVVDGVLIVPRGTHGGGGLIGLDAETGKPLWEIKEAVRGSRATPTWWTHEGKSYLIVANEAIRCIEPRTGRLFWTCPTEGNNYQSVVVGGDFLIAKPRNVQVKVPGSNRVRAGDKGTLGCYWLSPAGARLLWELPGEKYVWDEQVPAIWRGHVYARLMYVGKGTDKEKSGSEGARGENSSGEQPSGEKLADGRSGGVCVELATGKLKGEFAAPFGGGDASTGVADGRVIADTDASHNKTCLFMIAADPACLSTLTAAWNPPHKQTSGYHPGMVHPLVAGRLFIRGAHAIHCYDLRKPQSKP
jgi:outer membrane protein assembly factor BamB